MVFLTLQRKFSEALCIMCLVSKKLTQLRFHGSQALIQFTDNWRDLSPLFRKRREVLLMNICNVAEMMVSFATCSCIYVSITLDVHQSVYFYEGYLLRG